MEAIVCEELTKEYVAGTRALDAANLTVEAGEFMVLVGPSGCGKSTLLRLLAGIEVPDSGRILIGDRDVTHVHPRERDVAMVFQNYALYPHMSVEQNIGYGLRVRGVPKRELKARVREVAEMLGIEDLLGRRPAALSGGQRQRVAMGRAIAREPRAYLMDEPLSNLDAKLRVTMRAGLSQLHERLGVTTVYVTHDQVEAMTLGQRSAVLRDGVLQQVGTPQALYSRPANLFVATFIGSPSMNVAEGVLDGDELTFAGWRLTVPTALRPRMRDGRVIVGIRPEALHEARSGPEHAAVVEAPVLVREDLGHETLLFFAVDADRVELDDVAAAQEGNDGIEATTGDGSRAVFCARIPGTASGEAGQLFRFAIDPSALCFFDPVTGANVSSGVEVAAAV